MQDAYDSALDRASLEAFEGIYEAEEIGEMVDRDKTFQKAIDLILERQLVNGMPEE